MSTGSKFTKFAAATGATLAIASSHAQWQGIAASNAAFDARFNAQLGAMRRQNGSRSRPSGSAIYRRTARVCVRNMRRCASRVAPT